MVVAVPILVIGIIMQLSLPDIVGAQESSGDIGAQAVVGTGFTYQGRLEKSGSGVNDTCDFNFALYDDASIGSRIGIVQTVSGVSVSDGYFAVELNRGNQFGYDAFTGQSRYLEIEVKCTGDVSFIPLNTGTPKRVALNAAPYAHGLRPGADIKSTGTALSISTSATSGGGLAVDATASSGNAAAIFATSAGSNGAALSGLNSSNGYGVYGSSSTGYGVYSNGAAHVEGDLTWKAKTSYISISAANFTPKSPSVTYTQYGYSLGSPVSGSKYYAPVQLPHGATVTSMNFVWYDTTSQAITCTLYVDAMGYAGPMQNSMGQIASTGTGGTGADFASLSGVYETIDNSSYIYYLEWEIGDGGTAGRGVIIEYTVAQPY
jgi:hypothetical protein